jgi:glyoxylase-like metal-dependent hydrolase (beta-lactamase superfamily II)
MQGTITTIHRPNVTVHTYTSPEDGLDANTHIVELNSQLLVIDTQWALPYAAEALEFASALKKPITRVYVSHDHPDHWFGSASFGAPIYSLQSTRDAIATSGDAMAARNHAAVGDLVPDHAIVPERIVAVGEETIDGVRFVFNEYKEVEAASLLVISAPDAGVVFAQDLLYNNLHLFIAEGHLDEWAKIVEAIKGKGFEVVIPGHGLPGGSELYDFALAYLAAAKPLLSSATTGEELKSALIEAFPAAGGIGMLDIQNSFIFGE